MYGDDPIQALFNQGPCPDTTLDSYAVAGSESGHLGIQIDLYNVMLLVGTQEKADIIGFEIGGNDILNNDSLLKSFPPDADENADKIMDDLIANIGNEISSLMSNHPKAKFILWTVPDVTITPDQSPFLTPEQMENIRAHTKRVNQFIMTYDVDRDVLVFNIYHLMQLAVANPPVLRGQKLIPPPAYAGHDHLFADTIHPTAVSNALLANSMIAYIRKKWSVNIIPYTEDELADLVKIPR